MQSLFSENGLSLTYFIEISATYILTLLLFFDQKVFRKSKWLHHSGVLLLIIWWILALISQTLATKMFATAMLVSFTIVEIAIRRKRKNLS